MKTKELRTLLIKELERTFEIWVIDAHTFTSHFPSSHKKTYLKNCLEIQNLSTLKISDLKISISKSGIPKSLPYWIYNVIFSSEKFGIKNYRIMVNI